MNEFQILPLGVGDFFSRHRYSTSFAVLANGHSVLVDCPSPLRKMMYEASRRAGVELDIPQIQHLILTHLHGDHANGLEELAFFKRFFQREKPALITIPEVLEVLWENRLKAVMGALSDIDSGAQTPQELADYFEVQNCEEHQTLEIAGMKLEIRRTRHFVPCFGFKLSFNGVTLGYSADTVFDPAHIEFLSSADAIIHECGCASGHTPLAPLAALPLEIRRKMRLVHLPDDYPVKDSPIPVLEDGRLYTVRPGPDGGLKPKD